MSRTIAIIMLDFFVMSAIAFFILQFIEPESDVQGRDAREPTIFRLEAAKSNFLIEFNKAHPGEETIDSIAIQDLVELGFAAHVKNYPTDDIPIIVSADDDGYTIVIASPPKGDFQIVTYVRRIKSMEYMLSKPNVAIMGGSVEGGMASNVLDISNSPVLIFDFGGS